MHGKIKNVSYLPDCLVTLLGKLLKQNKEFVVKKMCIKSSEQEYRYVHSLAKKTQSIQKSMRERDFEIQRIKKSMGKGKNDIPSTLEEEFEYQEYMKIQDKLQSRLIRLETLNEKDQATLDSMKRVAYIAFDLHKENTTLKILAFKRGCKDSSMDDVKLDQKAKDLLDKLLQGGNDYGTQLVMEV